MYYQILLCTVEVSIEGATFESFIYETGGPVGLQNSNEQSTSSIDWLQAITADQPVYGSS
jgi:hypothetical protein